MKLKHSLLVGALTCLLGVGAAVGLGAEKEKAPMKADAAFAGEYSIIGSLGYYGQSWDADHDLGFEVDSNIGRVVVKFKSGDEFKIRLSHDWGTSYGADALDGTFPGFGGTNNITVSSQGDGYHEVVFNKDTHKITSITKLTNSTKRLYFDINDSGVSWQTESNKNFSLYCHYFGGTSETTWPGTSLMSSTISQFNRSIYYCDVPVDSTSAIFVRSPNDNTTDAWNRWNVAKSYRIQLGYNYFQPDWWDDSGTHKFNGWEDATSAWGTMNEDAGGNPFKGYRAYNSTLHVNSTTTTELAISWSEYNPTPSVVGQEFINWCTNSGLTADYSSAVPSADLELWAKFAVSAKIVFKDSTEGDTLALSATEWSVTSTFAKGDEFKIVKTFNNSTTADYTTLQSGLESIATVEDGYIKMAKGGTYSMYLKLPSDASNPNQIYIMVASDSSEAYSFADFFLANVGCDPKGLAVPTGWSTCSTRYDTMLSDAAKNYIYNFDVEGKEATDKIVMMLATYNWAIAHNPNNLSHFITNAAGTARVVEHTSVNPISVFGNSENTNVAIWIIVASAVTLASVGAFFLIKKRKEDR